MTHVGFDKPCSYCILSTSLFRCKCSKGKHIWLNSWCTANQQNVQSLSFWQNENRDNKLTKISRQNHHNNGLYSLSSLRRSRFRNFFRVCIVSPHFTGKRINVSPFTHLSVALPNNRVKGWKIPLLLFSIFVSFLPKFHHAPIFRGGWSSVPNCQNIRISYHLRQDSINWEISWVAGVSGCLSELSLLGIQSKICSKQYDDDFVP